MKYKVGDKVKIREDLKPWDSYGYKYATRPMYDLRGKIARITGVGKSGRHYSIDLLPEIDWSEEMFECKVSGNINIYVEGNKVIAFNEETGKHGMARCHPDDNFDFYTGAKIALERLEEAEKPYGWLKRGIRYYVAKPTYSDYYDWRTYHNDENDDRYKQRRLIFQTKEEAIECAKKMLAVVKQGADND